MSGLPPDTRHMMARQLRELDRKLDVLRQRAGETPGALLDEAITELAGTVEELRVAQEELRQQADELHASHLLLEAERQRYVDLFDFAPDGYLVTDALGVIREVNAAAARMLNRPQNQLPGKPLALYVAPEAIREFRRQLVEVAESTQVMVWETTLKPVPPREAPHSVECTVAAAHDPLTGRLLELRWRLHDNTERKKAEAELHESHESLRQLSGRLEAVVEEERERIARAVHDEIGAALTAIKMDIAQVRTGLERLDNGQHGETRELQDRTLVTSAFIDDTMQKVRRIAMELRPAILDDFGLVAALDMLLNDFQKRSGLQCSLNVAPGSAKLNKPNATAVFRVFQEILTNVARHANATKVEVRLSQSGDELVLDVRDNGRGLQPEDIQRPASLGMLGMRERMRSVGGTVEVSNRPSGGTHVCVRIPLLNPAASSAE